MIRRIFQLCLIAGLTTSPLQAQTDPFTGTWKLVKLTDQMKVTKIGDTRYAFDFGGGAETIAIDGTFQPGYAGTTLSVAADGPRWKVVRKQGSRMLLTATWTLSPDGNSLYDDFTSFGQDGSRSTVKYHYARKAAGSGFAGTWVTTSAAVNSGTTIQIRPYEGTGLSIFTPSIGQTLHAIFDGKEYPGATAGSTTSARRLGASIVEIVRKSNGKITLTRRLALSPDLKTLTMTEHVAGTEQPYIYVFERQ